MPEQQPGRDRATTGGGGQSPTTTEPTTPGSGNSQGGGQSPTATTSTTPSSGNYQNPLPPMVPLAVPNFTNSDLQRMESILTSSNHRNDYGSSIFDYTVNSIESKSFLDNMKTNKSSIQEYQSSYSRYGDSIDQYYLDNDNYYAEMTIGQHSVALTIDDNGTFDTIINGNRNWNDPYLYSTNNNLYYNGLTSAINTYDQTVANGEIDIFIDFDGYGYYVDVDIYHDSTLQDWWIDLAVINGEFSDSYGQFPTIRGFFYGPLQEEIAGFYKSGNWLGSFVAHEK